MSQSTLTIAMLGTILTSVLYIYIGRVIRKRQVSPDARLANGMFVLWWHSLGALGLLGALMVGTYMTGRLEPWMHYAATTVVLLALFLALWGLQFYLLYLYTGSRRWFMPLTAFYAALFVATQGLVAYLGAPDAITDDGWQLEREPEVDLGRAFGLGFAALIIGPAFVTAIAYARLYRKTQDRTQRYRIALVTGSIIVWFGSSAVGTLLGISQGPSWQIFSRIIGILSATVILMAYKPPKWIRDKYGIEGTVAEEA